MFNKEQSLGARVPIVLLLEVPLVLVDAVLDQGGMHLGVVNQDEIGSEQWAAHHTQVIGECLLLVRVVPVHELADRKLKCLFHVSLFEEFLEHGVHPLEENGRAPHHLELVGSAQGHTHYQSAILYRVRWEIVAQFGLELCEKHEVLA